MNIQEEVQKIHNQFGVSEMANYKIQLLCEKYASIQVDKEIHKIKDIEIRKGPYNPPKRSPNFEAERNNVPNQRHLLK